MSANAKVADQRQRSSADTRQRLLSAAAELFAERGYERTTIRDIGHSAGVDPTLIARYFGGKAALYLDALRTDAAGAGPIDVTDPARIGRLLERVDTNGPTPTFYAVVRPHDDEQLQAAAMAVIEQRLVAPTEQLAVERDDARLRAELVSAALAGVVLSRTSGAFDALSSTPAEQLAPLLSQLLGSLLDVRQRPTA